MRLFSQPVTNWPDIVSDNFACFKTKLHDTLKSEIGIELFDNSITEYRNEFHLNEKQAVKNPQIIQMIIKEANKQGKSSTTLENIVTKIIALKN